MLLLFIFLIFCFIFYYIIMYGVQRMCYGHERFFTSSVRVCANDNNSKYVFYDFKTLRNCKYGNSRVRVCFFFFFCYFSFSSSSTFISSFFFFFFLKCSLTVVSSDKTQRRSIVFLFRKTIAIFLTGKTIISEKRLSSHI